MRSTQFAAACSMVPVASDVTTGRKYKVRSPPVHGSRISSTHIMEMWVAGNVGVRAPLLTVTSFYPLDRAPIVACAGNPIDIAATKGVMGGLFPGSCIQGAECWAGVQPGFRNSYQPSCWILWGSFFRGFVRGWILCYSSSCRNCMLHCPDIGLLLATFGPASRKWILLACGHMWGTVLGMALLCHSIQRAACTYISVHVDMDL